MYSLVEFAEDAGGGLAVVSSKWLTPFKKEVFWPPYKHSKLFNKAVQKGEEVSDEKWKLYSVSKVYYTTGKYNNLKLATPSLGGPVVW